MSVGKAAAQAAHAAAMVDTSNWPVHPVRTIIVLEARDEEHMNNIRRYLSERRIDLGTIVDEGANEIQPMSTTAMYSCVLDKNDEDIQKIMSQFKLYRDTIRISMEVDR